MSIAIRLAAVVLLASTIAAGAHSFNKGDITVGHPWARATPEGADAGVGYVKITNAGKQADRLTGGSFNGDGVVEIHEMKMDGDVMKMRQLKDGLEIAAGATVELKPGGNHLMFTGLKSAIVEGPKVKGTLNFEKAGAIDVEFMIEPVGASESTDHKH
jgi:periplasmic copper chaperone A